MAVISVPRSEPWVVARWAFREVLEHVLDKLDDELDIRATEQALALDGLHLNLLPKDQALRLAHVLEGVSEELRVSLLDSPGADPRDRELADYLNTLEARLREVYG
jgi:hypothetical protein